MTYSVIITNYNGAGVLKKNLPKVFAAVGDHEVIVVDDASTDESLTVLQNLKKKYKSLRIVKKAKNEGFSSTTNLGVSKAKSDLVVLLNSDVVPEKNFLTSVLPLFEKRDVFAVSLCDKSYEDDKIVLRGRGVGKFVRGFAMHRLGEIKDGESLWANGGSGVFRRELWQRLGGLNEIYNPAYGEDWDLGYRAWKAGYKIFFSKNALVNHYHETGAMRKRYSAFYRRTVTFRNQLLFILINITDYKYLLGSLFWVPYYGIIKAFWRDDFAMLAGLLWFILYLPKAFISRQKTVPLFSNSDVNVFSRFSTEFKTKNEEIF
jgi:GT2 family glycosyltransferase